MSNMGYCKFQNTLGDLLEIFDEDGFTDLELSTEETKARKQLIELCQEIAHLYGDDNE